MTAPKLFSISISAEASTDLLEIMEYIAQHTLKNAQHYGNSILKKIRTLKHSPKRCPVIKDGDSFNDELRHLLHPPYRILFMIKNSKVIILRIIHGARKLDS